MGATTSNRSLLGTGRGEGGGVNITNDNQDFLQSSTDDDEQMKSRSQRSLPTVRSQVSEKVVSSVSPYSEEKRKFIFTS